MTDKKRLDPVLLAGTLLFTGFLAFTPLGCGSATSPWPKDVNGPRVLVTFAPLYCFVNNVAGEDAAVLTLASTSGPHHYEPTVNEILRLREADLFFVNSLDLDERYADRMARSSNNARLQGENPPGYIRIGERLLARKGLIDKMSGHTEHDHAHAGHHHHGEYDPHIWLGIPQAKAMVEVIRDELARANPGRKDAYEKRAADYLARLDRLHEEGQKLLNDKTERSLVTNHDSLHYFTKSFGLEVAGIIQIQAGSDPSGATFAGLVKTCKERKVRVIATEPQFQQRSAAETLVQTLKDKAGLDAVVIELDPLETASDEQALKDPKWYEERMLANLKTLAGALR